MNLLSQQIDWLDKRVVLSIMDKDYIAFALKDYAEKYHESKVKELNLRSVTQLREPLITFHKWLFGFGNNEASAAVDEYIKESNNGG